MSSFAFGPSKKCFAEALTEGNDVPAQSDLYFVAWLTMLPTIEPGLYLIVSPCVKSLG